tara:strand:+ start:16 stop:318 length:303 start_codon:yes stop_codon:yes gene_type:complete
MSGHIHPLICPVCEESFVVELGYQHLDSSGEANDNIVVMGKCPKCEFHVAADFHYNESSSNQQMAWLNEKTHRESYVETTDWVEKWMTHEDADKNEEEET